MELSVGLGPTSVLRSVLAAGPIPPTALGLLADLVLERDTVMAPRHLSADFTGPNLSFALAPGSDPLPTGLTLSGSGNLSGTPTVDAGPLNIVIRATNGEGSADSGFSLTVQEMLLDFTATLNGLTANPAFGPSAQDGVALTAEATDFSGSTPGSIAYQWKTLESGDIAGATGTSYTPNAALLDGETLFCAITPAGYPTRNTAQAVIRYAPPVLSGTPGDQFWDIDTGPQAIDMSTHVSGETLAWSVVGQGASIDPATGLLSIRTESQAIGATASVRATNSGGAVSIVFAFTIEDIDAGPGPALGVPILDDVTDTIGLTVDEAGTIYWRRDPSGTNPDPGDVILGGGFDSGSFAVTAGANAVDITFAVGNDGVQEISFVAAATPDEPSLVRTAAIDIDTSSAAPSAVIDTDFASGFTTAQAALWASLQANPYNATVQHRGSETWDAYPASLTDGGVVGAKTGPYPQLRFKVDVEAGKTYEIDADFPVGEGTWQGPLRVKLGSALDLNDYAQIDETQAGQPRVVELRGQTITATTSELWFALIIETGAAGASGGNPAISMLRVQEV